MSGDARAGRVGRLLAAAGATVGFLPEHEALALFGAACEVLGRGLGPLLEVGAYRGRSTLYLAAALASVDAAPTVLYSLDHHRGSEEMQAGWEHHDPALVDTSGTMDSLGAWRETVASAGAEDLVVGVVGESSRVAAHWSTPLALVFIDGGHGRAVAFGDYEGWGPKVIPGGYLVFHDVFEDEAAGGRPPYECYRAALGSGYFVEVERLSCASLRVLQRCDVPATPSRRAVAEDGRSASSASSTAAAE